MSGPDHMGDLPARKPGSDTTRCAEYVLGLLSRDEARAFEQRLTAEPELRAGVIWWAERFGELADTLPEVEPPREVLSAIERRAFGTRRVSPGRALLPYLLGGVAAAMLVWVLTVAGVLNPSGPPDLFADLAIGDRGLAFEAQYAADSGTFTLRREAGTLTEGRALQIWLLPKGDAAPVSLGPVQPDRVTYVEVPQSLVPGMPGARVAISQEPSGGSPGVAPSGPLLASGTLAPR